jgi:hypothetical protein
VTVLYQQQSLSHPGTSISHAIALTFLRTLRLHTSLFDQHEIKPEITAHCKLFVSR